MSNKKTLAIMQKSEADRAGVSSLANRPNGASRYGDGGLSAEALKARFDALPNLVIARFNSIAGMLASNDASKYITIGDAENALGECLYDFLLLFGEREENGKNISDHIKVRYTKSDESESKSTDLATVIADLQARIVELEGKH